MPPPYRIGLTGGIGSGKSTVAALFEKLGVPVIDADAIARRLVEPGGSAYEQVIALAGREVLAADGRLRRDVLREVVFRNEALRKQLEAVLHPLVYAEMEAAISNITYPYCILNIPLLVETGAAAHVDRILVVDIPEDVQIARTIERDGTAGEEVRRIIAAQAGRTERLQVADDVIDNSRDTGRLEEQVRTLHARYLELAADR